MDKRKFKSNTVLPLDHQSVRPIDSIRQEESKDQPSSNTLRSPLRHQQVAPKQQLSHRAGEEETKEREEQAPVQREQPNEPSRVESV